ncbi:LOW QUALITY PROTEIN: hypothetical protein CVT26_000878 [Gymnopilus dilepis]|uniref:Uncharacterized protein n=1 Tax=Gymnopilus dilepis TaxID=231916 RepID=A0A409YLH0_9AGAR|nr:LOW QUALITY PROTEIN: hypothetical protein CVT26_000878 [Gymnopilus dilepis]
MLALMVLSSVATLLFVYIFMPALWLSIVASDDLDPHESGLTYVASRNPFRETGPPANMAKLILLRHKEAAQFLPFAPPITDIRQHHASNDQTVLDALWKVVRRKATPLTPASNSTFPPPSPILPGCVLLLNIPPYSISYGSVPLICIVRCPATSCQLSPLVCRLLPTSYSYFIKYREHIGLRTTTNPYQITCEMLTLITERTLGAALGLFVAVHDVDAEADFVAKGPLPVPVFDFAFACPVMADPPTDRDIPALRILFSSYHCLLKWPIPFADLRNTTPW